MNEQEEILVRQSKWSGRRVVLLYWFAIVFIGTAAAAGLGVTTFDPKYKFEAADDPWHAAIQDPWHAEDCAGSGCHDDVIATWNQTWHWTMIGEFDPLDNAVNGSKVSYNSTHYWRTPNTPTDPLDLTNTTNIQYWTYNQLFNATDQQCCMTTRWYNVTTINMTTEEILWQNATLIAAGFTNNVWDMGISCAACHAEPGEKDLSYKVCSSCHGPGGMQWMTYWAFGRANHYSALSDLLASGDYDSLTMQNYIGQSTYMNLADLNDTEYYRITCVTCHDPMDASYNTVEESGDKSPWTNPYTNQTFGPSGSQLRATTINDLCGTCHDISLDTSRATFDDPSDHVGLDCTDCHGYYWEPAHNDTDRWGNTVWVNATFSDLDHDFVAPDDADDCALCHGNENATVWATMETYLESFGNTTDAKAAYDTKLAEAMAKYEEASGTVGVNTSSLANARALIEEAEYLVPDEGTFHNPLSPFAENQLALALVKLDESIVEANAAIANAINPTVTVDVTVDHTEEVNVTVEVDNTVEVDHTVGATETVTTTAPAIGVIAVLGILAAAAYFVRKRR